MTGDDALSAFVASLLETDMEKRPASDAVVRRLAELRSLHPRPVLEVNAARSLDLSGALDRVRPDPRTLRCRAESPKAPLRLVSRDLGAAGGRRGCVPAVTAPGATVPPPPHTVAPAQGVAGGEGPRPGMGGSFLPSASSLSLVACAVAAFVFLSR